MAPRSPALRRHLRVCSSVSTLTYDAPEGAKRLELLWTRYHVLFIVRDHHAIYGQRIFANTPQRAVHAQESGNRPSGPMPTNSLALRTERSGRSRCAQADSAQVRPEQDS